MGTRGQKDKNPVTPRKPWTTPTVERQGSVDELVQIVKLSGDQDSSGTKRNPAAH